MRTVVRFNTGVSQEVGFEFVRSIEFLVASRLCLEGTLELLDRIMNEFVSFQFVSSIESSRTDITSVRFSSRVYDKMDFEIIGSLKSLVTEVTLVKNSTPMSHQMPSQVPLTGKDLQTLWTWIVMSTRCKMVFQSSRCCVFVQTFLTPVVPRR
jgi:hypothetical protein